MKPAAMNPLITASGQAARMKGHAGKRTDILFTGKHRPFIPSTFHIAADMSQDKFFKLLVAGHSISDICRTTFAQACHLCDSKICGDNDNPLILEIKKLVEERRKLKERIKELEKGE